MSELLLAVRETPPVVDFVADPTLLFERIHEIRRGLSTAIDNQNRQAAAILVAEADELMDICVKYNLPLPKLTYPQIKTLYATHFPPEKNSLFKKIRAGINI